MGFATTSFVEQQHYLTEATLPTDIIRGDLKQNSVFQELMTILDAKGIAKVENGRIVAGTEKEGSADD